MDIKKINFKDKRYVLPLIVLPFLLFLSFQFNKLFGQKKIENEIPLQELNLNLGETQDSILSKNAAYDNTFGKGDGRSMLDGLDKENDSLMYYGDNLDYQQKRYIDSLRSIRSMQGNHAANNQRSYYNEPNRNNEQRDYQRSADLIRMLNSEGQGQSKNPYPQNDPVAQQKKEDDPVTTLKKQMLVMDSIEKARDPEYQAQLRAEERVKKNQDKLNKFLNSTLRVSKSSLNPAFNSISKKGDDNFIKAVIDQNTKGYLGSRIRFRLLEDITVGTQKIEKGNFLYANITGFEQQRVLLNVVSILSNGDILPINLSVYDLDGMKGLYVPHSAFREMMREMGTNSVQGTQLQSGEEGFFTSMASKLFSSTSRSIANILRQNKTKLKYNSYIYLINEQTLKNNEKY